MKKANHIFIAYKKYKKIENKITIWRNDEKICLYSNKT